MKFALPAIVLSFAGLQVWAGENWPQFRGPLQNGSSKETGLPSKFSKTENVLWTADMPGPSGATPAVWEDSVFVSSTNVSTERLEAICLDRKTGKQRWKKEIGDKLRQDNRSTYSTPSPATDGQRVVFFYGTGDLVCFDLEGKELWKHNIQKEHGPFAFLWTFSSSPMIHAGKVYLQVLQRDVPVRESAGSSGRIPSYILAYDVATGKELWKHTRPADAVAESLEAFTTPAIHRHDGQEQMLVAGGDCLTGHDPVSGKELWRWGTWNPGKIGHWRLVPSPVGGDGVALVCAPKREPVFGIKLGLSGNLDAKAVAWTSQDKEITSDVSTPAYHDGRFYIANSDRSSIACVEPKTGKIIWSERMKAKKFEASPTVADGKIYIMDHAGEVFVFKTGDKFELLHRVAMGEDDAQDTRSSVAAAQGCLFIRANTKLYCVGKS